MPSTSCSVVLHFCWVFVNVWERNTTGSSWPLCSCDNSSTGIIWSICVYYVAFGRIWVMEDWCFNQSTFKGIEWCVVTWCPGKFCIINSKGCEGCCYPSKVLDELMVLINKANECSYLYSILVGFISLTAVVLEGSGFIPVGLRSLPR